MIKIRIVYPKDNTFEETYVCCPKCSREILFYSVPPKKCVYCSNILPDVRLLKSMSNYRINWHKDIKNA